MSIATELSNYQTFLTDAYNKCEDKGATMPQNKNLQNLTTCIDSILPYIELDYIETTGTQHIDTGFKPNSNTKVEVKTYYKRGTSSNIGMFLYGSRNGNTEMFGAYIDASTDLSHGDRVEARYGTQFGTRLQMSNAAQHIFLQDKNKFILDGSATITVTANTFQASYNMYIFGVNAAGTASTLAVSGNRIYYMKIYDNDTLVRDFIPVIDRSGVVCLYDKVTKTFFYNAGTGTFNYGTINS